MVTNYPAVRIFFFVLPGEKQGSGAVLYKRWNFNSTCLESFVIPSVVVPRTRVIRSSENTRGRHPGHSHTVPRFTYPRALRSSLRTCATRNSSPSPTPLSSSDILNYWVLRLKRNPASTVRGLREFSFSNCADVPFPRTLCSTCLSLYRAHYREVFSGKLYLRVQILSTTVS